MGVVLQQLIQSLARLPVVARFSLGQRQPVVDGLWVLRVTLQLGIKAFDGVQRAG
jgi:hypothetical protein